MVDVIKTYDVFIWVQLISQRGFYAASVKGNG